MPFRSTFAKTSRILLISVCTLMMLLSGCSRRFWRRQAERDTYEAVHDKLNDPHWAVPRVGLQPDSRSRFYSPWNPDCEPLPPDDPAAHRTMHCVSGRRGYKNWHKLGTALSIENPQWLEPFGVLMENADPVHGHSQVQLDDLTLKQTVELSYIHDREYQSIIEDVYLTALAVTEEQFNLGVRYIGVGGRVPGLTAGVTDNPGGDNTINLDPRFGISQLLPAGTQIAVELANNTLWLFGGGTASSASTLAFSLTQPLLYRAGRKVILEALTQAERNVLYSVRDLARFRQTLFTETTAAFLAIQLQLQAIRNLEGNIRRVEDQIEIRRAEDSKVPEVIGWDLLELPVDAVIPESLEGLLTYDALTQTLRWRGDMTQEQIEQIISVSDDPRYRAAASQLVRQRTQEVTNQPAAQLLTTLNGQQNRLQDARNRLANLTDEFKIALGLPPDIHMSLDDSILDQFTLIDPTLLQLDRALRELAERRGPEVLLDTESEDEELTVALVPAIRTYLAELMSLKSQIAQEVDNISGEFVPVDLLLSAADGEPLSDEIPIRRKFGSEAERQRVLSDVDRDRKLFRLTEQDFEGISILLAMILEVTSEDDFPASLDADGDGIVAPAEFPELWPEIREDNLTDDQPRTYGEVIAEARGGILILREELLALLQSLQVIQADLRVERIAVNQFVLPGGTETPDINEVVRIGLSRRHDLMNARAQVMDARRFVEVAANELEATLDVTLAGELGTLPSSRKPFNFKDSAARYDAGLRLDTPADKITERNTYNAALIDYQRARRDYMALEDEVKRQIRFSWRELMVSMQRLEIDRQGVRAAGLQLDIAASGPGQDDALSLLRALESVLNAQNSLVSDWISYELSRLNIYRDMGIMEIDAQGMWIDGFYVDVTELRPDISDQPTEPPPLTPLPAADPLPPAAADPVVNDDTGDGEQE